jgi:hypothetical protein
MQDFKQQLLGMTKNHFEKLVREKCRKGVNRAEIWQQLLEGVANVVRVTLPCVCPEIVQDLFWDKVPVQSREDGGYDGGNQWVAIFNSQEDMAPVFGDMNLFSSFELDGESEHMFFCPFAHVCLSFQFQDYVCYQKLYEKNNWKPIYVCIEVEMGGEFSRSAYSINNVKVFVLKKFLGSGVFEGVRQKMTFCEVFVPDKMKNLQELFSGVRLYGERGVIPQKFLFWGDCKNPRISYKSEDMQLNIFSFTFRPECAKNGILQCNVRMEMEDEHAEVVLAMYIYI